MKKMITLICFVAGMLPIAIGTAAAQKPRARDIGIPFDGTPGKYNLLKNRIKKTTL
jgi:hypothetical protein